MNRRYIAFFLMMSALFICRRHVAEIPHTLKLEPVWSSADSLQFYFPVNEDATRGFLKKDFFSENWYSSALFSFREPILYNKNSATEWYRFFWLRSFDRPVVFGLHRSGATITLTTKILDHQPEFLEKRYDPRGWPDLDKQLKRKTIQRIGDSLIVVPPDRKASIVYDSTITITLNDWRNFEQLLRQAHDVYYYPFNNDTRVSVNQICKK